MATLVSSVLVSDQPQIGGYRCVVERHTWDDGVVLVLQRHCALGEDAAGVVQADGLTADAERTAQDNAGVARTALKRATVKIAAWADAQSNAVLNSQVGLAAGEILAWRNRPQ